MRRRKKAVDGVTAVPGQAALGSGRPVWPAEVSLPVSKFQNVHGVLAVPPLSFLYVSAVILFLLRVCLIESKSKQGEQQRAKEKQIPHGAGSQTQDLMPGSWGHEPKAEA